jgi:hypothetical protein
MLVDLVTLLYAVIFIGWGAVSIVNQFSTVLRSERFSRFIRRMKRHDYFSLIPIWTFFAPNPGTRDFNILYRHKLGNGSYTLWRQLVDNDPPVTAVVWNPTKRKKKAILDLAMFLCRSLPTKPEDEKIRGLFLTVPYLGLAGAVSSTAAVPMSDGVQFMILLSHGHHAARRPDVLFISPLFACR